MRGGASDSPTTLLPFILSFYSLLSSFLFVIGPRTVTYPICSFYRMAQSHNDAACCQGCGLEGPKLWIIEHLWEELSAQDVPFQCLDCNARFHRQWYAVWHMKTEHGYQKPIQDAFTGSLRDLPVYSMVGNNLNLRWRQPQHGGTITMETMP